MGSGAALPQALVLQGIQTYFNHSQGMQQTSSQEFYGGEGDEGAARLGAGELLEPLGPVRHRHRRRFQDPGRRCDTRPPPRVKLTSNDPGRLLPLSYPWLRGPPSRRCGHFFSRGGQRG